ncbi:MAG: tautomerase family protein [Cloacibacillus sp.]
MPNIPWLLVYIQMFEGRSINQKRELVQETTAIISKNFNIPPEMIQITINEVNRINNSTNGVLVLDQTANIVNKKH